MFIIIIYSYFLYGFLYNCLIIIEIYEPFLSLIASFLTFTYRNQMIQVLNIRVFIFRQIFIIIINHHLKSSFFVLSVLITLYCFIYIFIFSIIFTFLSFVINYFVNNMELYHKSCFFIFFDFDFIYLIKFFKVFND